MVTLYVGGQRVGSRAEAEKLFAKTARTRPVEFRDEHDAVIATSTPRPEPDPDWVKAITPEETARRKAEPGFTFEELKKRLG